MRIRFLIVAAGLVLVAGCSSSGTMTVTKPLTETIPAGSTVSLEVRPGTDEDAPNVARDIRADLFGFLVAEGIFRQVVQPGEPADYRMEIALSGVDEVSQGARIVGGVFAGPNTVTAAMTLFRAADGAVVAQATATGKSASNLYLSEDDIRDAEREVIDKLLAALRRPAT